MIYRLLYGKHFRWEDGVRVRYVGQNLKPPGQPGDLVDLSEREAYAMRTRIATTEGLRVESMGAPLAKALEKRRDAAQGANQRALADAVADGRGAAGEGDVGEGDDALTRSPGDEADETDVSPPSRRSQSGRARGGRAAVPRGGRGRNARTRTPSRASGARKARIGDETDNAAPAAPTRVKPSFRVEAVTEGDDDAGFNVVSVLDGEPVNGEPLSEQDANELAVSLSKGSAPEPNTNLSSN